MHFELRTLGDVSLSGPAGAVTLDEPRLIALLVMLAVGEAGGVPEDELLLRLLPDARPEQARTELARLLAVLRLRLGGEASVWRVEGRYGLAPGLVSADVRVLPEPRDAEREDFLAGFRLPGSPEFREWLAGMRRRVEPRAGAARSTPPVRTRRARLLTTLAVLVVAASAAAYFWRPRGAEGFATGDPIVLADVQNETGDSVFDGGLLSAATIGLQQSGHLRLYPRSRLPDVYRLMAVDNRDTTLTFELAQEVAERDGVRFVLGLRIDREADGYRISGELADVALHRSLGSTAFAERKSDVIEALDRVLLTVRRQLGESQAALATRRLPLPQVTTSSLEALRSFGDGARAWDHGDYKLAAELWQRAVDLDTGFATAYGALGRHHYYHHDREQGERYYQEALKRTGRLTERERLRLLESRAASRGDLDSAVGVGRIIAEEYPSAPTWFNYGTALMQAQRNADAVPALRRSLSYDSSSSTSSMVWINLATALGRLDRDEESLAAYRQADRVDTAALYRNNINHEYGMALVRMGRLAEAESAYRRMAAAPAIAGRAAGLRSLGYLALWRGHIEEAADYYRRAIEATVQMKAPMSEARNRLLLASTYRLGGRTPDANKELDVVMAGLGAPSYEPRFLAFVVTGLVKLGRVNDADSVLRVLRTRVDRQSDPDLAAEAFVSGTVHLAKNRPDSALWYVRRVGRPQQTVPHLALEAAAYQALEQRDSARVVVMRLLHETGFGFEGQEDWLRALVVLGDLLLADGDTAAARASYRRLLDQWREAPPTLPDLAAARARLAALDDRDRRAR